jgi:TPR repeat protein
MYYPKHIMKKLILIIMVLTSHTVLAQNAPVVTAEGTKINLAVARVSMDPRNKGYNPEKGYAIYKDYAARGNPEAMNAMGMIYNNGLAGVTADTKAAFNWFTKAANANYSSACFNV